MLARQDMVNVISRSNLWKIRIEYTAMKYQLCFISFALRLLNINTVPALLANTACRQNGGYYWQVEFFAGPLECNMLRTKNIDLLSGNPKIEIVGFVASQNIMYRRMGWFGTVGWVGTATKYPYFNVVFTFLLIFLVDSIIPISSKSIPRKICFKYFQCPKIMTKNWVKKVTYDEVQIMSDVEGDCTIFSFGFVVGCLNV